MQMKGPTPALRFPESSLPLGFFEKGYFLPPQNLTSKPMSFPSTIIQTLWQLDWQEMSSVSSRYQLQAFQLGIEYKTDV